MALSSASTARPAFRASRPSVETLAAGLWHIIDGELQEVHSHPATLASLMG
jgi:hypothetical protein